MTEPYIQLENRSAHLNSDPGTGAILYVVNGVPYVRTTTVIKGIKITSTSNGVVTTPTTMVQTYATADPTLSAYTPNSQAAALTTLGATTDIASMADLNTLRLAYENLRAFTEDLAKFVNSLTDTLQAQGLAN